MTLTNKTIAILLENQYQELEVWYPYYRLKEEGAEVWLVAPEKGKEYHGKFGYPAMSEKSIDEIAAIDLDAIVIPGGYAPDYMRRNKKMIELVRDMDKNNKIIAAICHAGWMLASADIVKGKRITSFFAIKDDMVHAGANWVDEEVVRNGNIITSRKPEDLPAFCRTMISALS
ncbi:MAG: protease I [Parcubacteria group bacterium Gr01-1014_29]|nr:MAG: protease I [Parcubacteria group bacterium Gr01-1014_29]